MSQNYYEILQLKADASLPEIEEAYQRLIRETNYPCGKNALAIKRTKELTKAYENLLEMNSFMSDDEDDAAELPEKEIFLTFEELYKGCKKRMTLRDMDGDKVVNNDFLWVKIKPGIEPGTRIECPQLEKIKKFVAIVRDKPNQRFRRLNDSLDVEYTCRITTNQSKSGCELLIPTLENDPISITYEDEISEADVEEFDGRGLPQFEDPTKRGKLVVRFRVSDKEDNDEMMSSRRDEDSVIIRRIKQKKHLEPKLKPNARPQQEGVKPKKPISTKKSPYANVIEVIEELKTFGNSDPGKPTSSTVQVIEPTYEVLELPSDQPKGGNVMESNFVFIDQEEPMEGVEESSSEQNDLPQKPREQLPPNEFPLILTLEEIFRGCTKTEKIVTKSIDKQGYQKRAEKTIEVEVEPGSIDGTHIVKEYEGDMAYGKTPADAIFMVKEKPHGTFKRFGYDLEFTARITAHEAIYGGAVDIPRFGEDFKFRFKGGKRANSEERISNQGLPILNKQNRYGDLIVKFDILNDAKIEQDPPVVHELQVSLEQVLKGLSKRVKIKRLVFDNDGAQYEEDKILKVDIKPGAVAGTRVEFPREGDQNLGKIPADVVFIMKDKPHERFVRTGADIEYTAKVSENQLSNGSQIPIPTLDPADGPKHLSLDGINPKKARRFANCGLPLVNDPSKRGNLIVHIKIVEDPQDDPIEHILELTLEQILTGCTKKIRIERKIFDAKENVLSTDRKIIKIDIPKGTFDGEKIVLEKRGDQRPGRKPADVVFLVRYKQHELFTVDGFDILYEAVITESEANGGVDLEIPTLEKEIIPFSGKRIRFDDVLTFHHFGLPFTGEPDKRGKLLLHFKIVDNKFKDPLIQQDLKLTLEEIHQGCTKKLKVKRNILGKDGAIQVDDKIVSIEVPPNSRSGKTFLRHRLGDQRSERIDADIEFVVKEQPHDLFKKRGNDIEYVAKVSEKEAKLGCELDIPTLDKNAVKIKVPKNLSEVYVHKIKGKGLCIPRDPKKRGDLLVRFEIQHSKKSDNQNGQTTSKNNSTSTSKIDLNNKDEKMQPKIETTSDSPNPSVKKDKSSDENKETPLQNEKLEEDVEYDLPLSLKDVLNGCTKRMRIKRKVVYANENQTKEECKIVLIQIEPGTEGGTKLVSSKKEDPKYAKPPADVTFVVTDKEHPYFKRNGAHILYIAKVTLDQLQNGAEVKIPTLEKGEYVPLKIDPTAANASRTQRIPGHGLPFANQIDKRGDIVVQFEIVTEVIDAPENDWHKKPKHLENQDPPVRLNVPLTLENFFYGCREGVRVTKQTFDANGYEVGRKKLTLPIDIGPGTPTGSSYRFSEVGDQWPGRVASDIVVTLTEIRHNRFQRLGVHLFYIKKITPEQAKKGCQVDIPTLDGRKIPFDVNPSTTHGTMKEIPGFGFPYPDNAQMRGNLLVRFEIHEKNIFEKGLEDAKKIFVKITNL